MGIVVGAFEAKTKLAELLDKVEAGDIVTITRRGKPIARLMPMEVGDREARLQEVIDEIIRTRKGKDRGAKPGVTIPELIKAGRRY
ncbi:MAG TPA: type II toxin-antitoxin system prevent-host-death family antitoxin [Burkholderiales bacterium]|jgi:prevent-host-death family protein|nr:type II toxin-antitoxin system prevent-host-death family antitoxin [Burkholderiales bacterium]